jgi:hypothetical protein
MNLRLFSFLVAMTVMAVCGSAHAQGGPPIHGTVISQSRGGPVSGITVSLVHPTLGRTTPVFTQADGYYSFTNVPPGQTYYIEAYLGDKLLYRQTVDYKGGSVPHDISLP